MAGKRKKNSSETELVSDLATLRIGRKLRGKVVRAIQVIYDACEIDIGNNKSSSQIFMHTGTEVGGKVEYAGENVNRGGPIVNLMLSVPRVKEEFNRSADPKYTMSKFEKSLEDSSVTLEVRFECKMLAKENTSSIPKRGVLRYVSTMQKRYKFLEFDCTYDPTEMIMRKGGKDFIYLTAKFTIDMKPPVD